MKTVILSETDTIKKTLVLHLDGSIELIHKWKDVELGDKRILLGHDEVKVLREKIKRHKPDNFTLRIIEETVG